MLLQEGFARGNEPSISVMEFASGKERRDSDLLPYLDTFAHFFAPLPNDYSQMNIHFRTVPLSDVECVTETVLKIDQPMKAINDKRGI